MKPLIDWIAHYRVFWTEHVDRLQKLLERLKNDAGGSGFKPTQKQNVGGARYGWKLMGGKLASLLGRIE